MKNKFIQLRYLIPILALLIAIKLPARADRPSTSHIQPSPLIAQGQWQPFQSDMGGYGISMPDSPVDDTKSFETQAGIVDFRISSVTSNGIFYGVGYGDYPEKDYGRKSSKDLLNELQTAALKSFEVKLKEEKDIKLGLYQGRELDFESPEGLVGKARILLVNRRMYVLGVITFKGNTDNWKSLGTQFMDSFKTFPSPGTRQGANSIIPSLVHGVL